jgi:PAS domain S-box
MSQPFSLNQAIYFLLSLLIIVFSSCTMFSMIESFKKRGRIAGHYWLLAGAGVFGLGLWAITFVAHLSSNYTLVVGWAVIPVLLAGVAMTYLSFLVMGKRKGSPGGMIVSSLLLSAASFPVHFFSLHSGNVAEYRLDAPLVALSAIVNFAGTLYAIRCFDRRPETARWIGGLVLGVTNMTTQLFVLKAMAFVRVETLTPDQLNEYFTVQGTMFGIATLVIFVFSLSAWMSDRKFLQSEERYRLLVENSMDMIAIISERQWEYVNRAGLKLFEAEPGNGLIGRPVFDYLHPRHHGEFSRLLKGEQSETNGIPIELEWYSVKKRPLHTEVVGTNTTYNGKPALQVIVRDITERKKNEKKVINSEKLYIAGQLAAGIAHEIRNPLTSLKGFLQLISTGRSAGKNYYDIMKADLGRIESVISELLMLSKPQIYELTRQDVRAMVADSLTLLKSKAVMSGISVVTSFEDRPLWINCVEVQIRQVFTNIMKNGIEAMPEGGSLRVACTLEADEVIVRIADDGPGLGEEQLSKIGQPFYTTKDKGTGLGLMVAFKIVQNHKGSVKTRSELGKGTAFEIRLPYAGSGVTEGAGMAANKKVRRSIGQS